MAGLAMSTCLNSLTTPVIHLISRLGYETFMLLMEVIKSHQEKRDIMLHARLRGHSFHRKGRVQPANASTGLIIIKLPSKAMSLSHIMLRP